MTYNPVYIQLMELDYISFGTPRSSREWITGILNGLKDQ